MILNDKVYNILKWTLLILVPALMTLISTLGTIYNFDSKILTATIGAFSTFVGAIIGISNINYNKSNEDDGTENTDIEDEK